MKEHRTKTLRVTNPHCLSGIGNSSTEIVKVASKDDLTDVPNEDIRRTELFGSLQALQVHIVSSSESNSRTTAQMATPYHYHSGGTGGGGRDTVAAAANDSSFSSYSSCRTQLHQQQRQRAVDDAMTEDIANDDNNSCFVCTSIGDDGSGGSSVYNRATTVASLNFASFSDNNTSTKSLQPANEEEGDVAEIQEEPDERTNSDSCRRFQGPENSQENCSESSSFNNNITRSKDIEENTSVLEIVYDNLTSNWFLKLQKIKEAIVKSRRKKEGENCWWEERDVDGNTALLVSGQTLLQEAEFDKALELATLLLDEGANINDANYENRTLLSYSIQYMDDSVQLTTMLLNYGANLWPVALEDTPESSNNGPSLSQFRISSNTSNSNSSNNYELGRSGIFLADFQNMSEVFARARVYSPFTWFLRSVIRLRKMDDHCLRTLHVLAQAMSENPQQMHSHVMTTMFTHARFYTILGPVFLQIKQVMSPHWSQPQTLKQMCRSAIRKSLLQNPNGPYPVNQQNMAKLRLPPPLQSYIMFQT